MNFVLRNIFLFNDNFAATYTNEFFYQCYKGWREDVYLYDVLFFNWLKHSITFPSDELGEEKAVVLEDCKVFPKVSHCLKGKLKVCLDGNILGIW